MDYPDDESTLRRPVGPTRSSSAEPYLLLLQGAGIGRVFRLSRASYELGRSLNADIQLDDDGVSRVHARLERKAGRTVLLTDLDSTNGSFVNGTRVENRELKDGDIIQFGKNVVLKYALQSEAEGNYAQQLYEAATRDSLTGLLNRRFFDEQLAKDIAHASRHNGSLSVLAYDLDHFKVINDTHGHPAGDRVLAAVSDQVKAGTREEDLVCRLGGEEFAVIMRGTDWDGAMTMAERLREGVEQLRVSAAEGPIQVTVSVGAATFDPDRHEGPDALLADADRALYRAKRGGRNRVEMSGSPPPRGCSVSPPPSDLKSTLS